MVHHHSATSQIPPQLAQSAQLIKSGLTLSLGVGLGLSLGLGFSATPIAWAGSIEAIDRASTPHPHHAAPPAIWPIAATSPTLTALKRLDSDSGVHPAFTADSNTVDLDRQARQAYDVGDYDRAASLLQTSIAALDTTRPAPSPERAILHRNLALIYLASDRLEASQTALETSREALGNLDRDRSDVQAIGLQIDEVQAQIARATGQPEVAAAHLQSLAADYTKLGDLTGLVRIEIARAQALQDLGLYRQSLKLLVALTDQIEAAPNISASDRAMKRRASLALGETLRAVGNLTTAQEVFEQAMQWAIEDGQALDETTAALGLGHIALANGDRDTAQDYYDRAIATAPDTDTQLRAELYRLELDLEPGKAAPTDPSSTPNSTPLKAKLSSLHSRIVALPNDHDGLSTRIQFARQLIKATAHDNEAARLLATTANLAHSLKDRRMESYALGYLGGLYEQQTRWAEAEQLTQRAIMVTEVLNANDLSYQWYWQLGRIYKAQNQRSAALSAYGEAVESLTKIRSDLVAISTDVQFSFREQVEPVYRERVNLLLNTSGEISQEHLRQARDTIEQLQLAELDNYFRDACLDAAPTEIDTIDRRAVVVYPIVLDDRLTTIVALPDQPLRVNTVKLEKTVFEQQLTYTKSLLINPRQRRQIDHLKESLSQIYGWTIAPFEEELQAAGIETIVFVPDGMLRNFPLNALYDGQQYLIERYAIALTPGLQLLPARRLQETPFQFLTGGLSQARRGFTEIPAVEGELKRLRLLSDRELFNEDFTDANLTQALDGQAFSIVHFATHGQFSSDAEETFLLTWDDKIAAHEFSNLLASPLRDRQPIELLVLSACQTAAGDDRAALGLAGIAVRAGARSTIASLWQVDDTATADLMVTLYEHLAIGDLEKAQALQQAQLAVLHQEATSHPFYWSAFVLVGNWQ